MKKIALGILVAAVALTLSGLAVAIPDGAADVAKEKAKAPDLEKIEFIHWKKGFAKPPCNGDGTCDPGENPSCGDCKKNGEGEEPTITCYAFMGQYGKRLLKWRELSVNYVINPTNSGLDPIFVESAISTSAETWDASTGPELFNPSSIDSKVAYRVQDDVNAISFENYYSNPDIIGATTVWYNPATKTIVEFDIVFETNYLWGDAANPETPNVMDLQNIATHELGHAVGLDDIYDEIECGEVTMYGYSIEGETDKRTLEEPDITGIQRLYGE